MSHTPQKPIAKAVTKAILEAEKWEGKLKQFDIEMIDLDYAEYNYYQKFIPLGIRIKALREI